MSFSDANKIPVWNPASLVPLEFRVIVKVGKIEEKIGNLILPDSVRDKDVHHQCEAVFIRGADLAFTDASGHKLPRSPQAGEKVVFAKYAGLPFKDKDNNLYRIANDKDIACVIEENAGL